MNYIRNIDEVGAALSGEIGRCAIRTAEYATSGLVLHALATIAEIQIIAARLAACAALRAAEEAQSVERAGTRARRNSRK